MIYGSVCSGIEAASVAWEPLGWKPAWFAEIDAAASRVLVHRFPNVPNHGDMTKLADLVRRRIIVAPDVLVGGTPCQAFSIAGLRGGMSDPRGQLTLAFVLLADAIDEVRAEDGLPPVIIVWENVPGVLNHRDNPFGCFLAGIAAETVPLVPPGGRWTNAGLVLGPQRTAAWRTIDAQWFGLAQRRRRVFVVASAHEWLDPGAILLEFEGVRRDSAPSREAGQETAGSLDARTKGGGFPGTDGACANHVIPYTLNGFANYSEKVKPSLRAYGADQGGGSESLICFTCKDYGADAQEDLSPTLRAGGFTTSHANAGVMPAIVQPICVTGNITHTLKADGFDASEDGTGRGQPIVATLDANYGKLQGCSGQDLGHNHSHLIVKCYKVRRLMPVECERLQGFPDNHTAIPAKNGKSIVADGPRYKQIGNSMAVQCMRWIGTRIAAALA